MIHSKSVKAAMDSISSKLYSKEKSACNVRGFKDSLLICVTSQIIRAISQLLSPTLLPQQHRESLQNEPLNWVCPRMAFPKWLLTPSPVDMSFLLSILYPKGQIIQFIELCLVLVNQCGFLGFVCFVCLCFSVPGSKSVCF